MLLAIDPTTIAILCLKSNYTTVTVNLNSKYNNISIRDSFKG